MADEYDYARQWPGSFQIPPDPDHEGGVYVDEGRHIRGGRVAERGYEKSEPYPDRLPPTCRRRESFRGSVAGIPPYRGGGSPDDRYARGTPALGHPGYRSQVTSARYARPAIEDAARNRAMVQPPLGKFETEGPKCGSGGSGAPAGSTLESFASSASQALSSPETLKIICCFLLLIILAMLVSRGGRVVPKTVIIVPSGTAGGGILPPQVAAASR